MTHSESPRADWPAYLVLAGLRSAHSSLAAEPFAQTSTIECGQLFKQKWTASALSQPK